MAPAKAARKAAKKLAGDHGRKRGDKDMLRAFEHLGRVSVLEKLLSGPSTGQIGVLIELAKSANTRNLIGGLITKESDVVALVRAMSIGRGDEALKKRLLQALERFERGGHRGSLFPPN